MVVCPHCAFNNKEGLLFCEDCGRRLITSDNSPTLPTKKVDENFDNFARRPTWGTARFETEASIVLDIRDSNKPITLKPLDQMIIGRVDSSSPLAPDLDLTPFGALEKGVSRVHAAIFRSEDTLMLVDKGSANGTHLNGQRLVPHQPRVLRNGDEIRLGKMIAHIYFKSVTA
ncbi:MAG: FHA domain-containing protein [Chloroflexota bacterium]|nr:FHA domain-containing protein [Chloroflexota bacterium]